MTTIQSERATFDKPEPIPVVSEADQATSDKYDLHLMSMWIQCSIANVGRPYDHVRTQAEVATAFGVSLRTVRDWVERGMPGKSGKYPLFQIQEWHRRHIKLTSTSAHNDLPRMIATGDLVKVLLRVFRYHIREAGAKACEDFRTIMPPPEGVDAETFEFAFKAALARHFDVLLLDEAEINRVLKECWAFV